MLANTSTNASSNILPHIFARMQHLQQLLIHIHTNQAVGGGQTSNCNTRRPLTCQTAT